MGDLKLDELKKEYGKLAEMHDLPDFKSLNEDFEIDKIDKDSDCLLRNVRKVIMEKIVSSLTFLEMLINPVNAPRIYFPYIQSMSADDKKMIDKLYGNLGELSIDSLALEIDYSERGEGEMIKKVFNSWKDIKPKFSKILADIRNPAIAEKQDRGYFS